MTTQPPHSSRCWSGSNFPWRSPHWGDSDIDSTLILAFHPEPQGSRIELVQVNVVDSDFAGVSDGWQKFYWAPWRDYLSRN